MNYFEIFCGVEFVGTASVMEVLEYSLNPKLDLVRTNYGYRTQDSKLRYLRVASNL